MKPRKIPLRKCVACQEMIPKRAMVRVVKTPQNEVLIDPSGKQSGRGAYLCGKVECLKSARKAKSLDRALKQEVGSAVYDQLELDFMRIEQRYNQFKDVFPSGKP